MRKKTKTVINRSSETKTRTNSICRVNTYIYILKKNRLEMTLVIVFYRKEKEPIAIS